MTCSRRWRRGHQSRRASLRCARQATSVDCSRPKMSAGRTARKCAMKTLARSSRPSDNTFALRDWRLALITRPPLTLGIEEEYMIIDPKTRALTSYVQEMLNRGRRILGEQIKAEFMQSQIEVGSQICANIEEAHQDLLRLRRSVTELAAEEGKVIAAAATHPFSRWREQAISE